jgi:hypothetical protein
MTPQLKTIVAVNAVSKTNAATASGLIDTLGYDWCTIDIIAATADVVSNKPTVLKLQEADTTDATNLADVVGFRGGTSVTTSIDFVIPNANTAATAVLQNNYKFNVDCRGRKRYLSPTISPATTQVITIIANLGRGEQAPVTAAKANAMTLVEG